MYAKFEREAREEGFTEIAEFFAAVAKAEEAHERRYRTLLTELREGKIFKKEVEVAWKCRNCGYLAAAAWEAPHVCPACAVGRRFFEKADAYYAR